MGVSSLSGSNGSSKAGAITKLKETAGEYGQHSTTHGVFYISVSKFGLVSRIFWLITVLCLTGFAIFLIVEAYTNWRENQILNSVGTTGHPVSDLQFPAVTICGLGMIENLLSNAIMSQAEAWIYKKNSLIGLASAEIVFNKTMSLAEFLDANGFLEKTYMEENFPGLNSSKDIRKLIQTLSSPNPDQFLFSLVATDDVNPNDGCTNKTNPCNTRYVYSDHLGGCARVAGQAEYAQGDYICSSSTTGLETVPDFYSPSDAKHLFELIQDPSSALNYLSEGQEFWYPVTRDAESGSFDVFGVEIWDMVETNLTHFAVNLTAYSFEGMNCYVLKYNASLGKLVGRSSHCDEYYEVLCIGYVQVCQKDGDVKKKKQSKLDLLMNPGTKSRLKGQLLSLKQEITSVFKSLDLTKSYDNLFEILWHSQLPCYETHSNTTVFFAHSMLRKCIYKSVVVPCAQVFDTFPTDQGMCCTFNMEKAEEIFKESQYQKMITKMQNQNRRNAKSSATLPQSYIQNKEPKPNQGIHKSLTLILDAQSGQLSSGSVREDFHGFLGTVGSPNQYPLLNQKRFLIRPGFENLISLTANHINASREIIKIDASIRQCYFENEHPLKFYEQYTRENCVLECNMNWTMKTMANESSEAKTCVPWFLPKDDSIEMCDPWSAKNFTDLLKAIPDNECSHCLPDCTMTDYHASVTIVPFRTCDERNLGVSFLCMPDTSGLPNPPIFGEDILNEYKMDPAFNGVVPDYIKRNVFSNVRKYENNAIFTAKGDDELKYDAYKKDIAVVKIYFETATVYKFTRELRMTLIDFIGQVGGLMGLCIGFSIASLVEIIYWFFFRYSSHLLSSTYVKPRKSGPLAWTKDKF